MEKRGSGDDGGWNRARAAFGAAVARLWEAMEDDVDLPPHGTAAQKLPHNSDRGAPIARSCRFRGPVTRPPPLAKPMLAGETDDSDDLRLLAASH